MFCEMGETDKIGLTLRLCLAIRIPPEFVIGNVEGNGRSGLPPESHPLFKNAAVESMNMALINILRFQNATIT